MDILKWNTACNAHLDNKSTSLDITSRKRKHTNDCTLASISAKRDNFVNTDSTIWNHRDLLVEDISVPSGIVGLLIGKGGTGHQRLQMISGARVYIAPDPPTKTRAEEHQRLVTITGPLEAVNQAKYFIQQAKRTGIIPFQLEPDFIPGHVCEDMLIPKEKVGLVIGRNGEKIKRLQEDTCCKMFLYMDGLHKNASEKTLRISGSVERVSHGKAVVEELLVNSEMERKEKMLVVSARLAKRLIGKKGASVKMIQKESSVYMHIIEDRGHSSSYRTFRLNGTDLMIQKAVAIMQDLTKDYTIAVRDPPKDWPTWAEHQIKQLRDKQQQQQHQHQQQKQKQL